MFENMGDMMGQMQKLQENMKAKQEEIMALEVLGEAGGGLVSIRMNGRRDVLSVHIDDTLVGDNKAVLQDLIKSALNDANQKLEKLMQSKMTQMMGFPFPQGGA